VTTALAEGILAAIIERDVTSLQVHLQALSDINGITEKTSALFQTTAVLDGQMQALGSVVDSIQGDLAKVQTNMAWIVDNTGEAAVPTITIDNVSDSVPIEGDEVDVSRITLSGEYTIGFSFTSTSALNSNWLLAPLTTAQFTVKRGGIYSDQMFTIEGLTISHGSDHIKVYKLEAGIRKVKKYSIYTTRDDSVELNNGVYTYRFTISASGDVAAGIIAFVMRSPNNYQLIVNGSKGYQSRDEIATNSITYHNEHDNEDATAVADGLYAMADYFANSLNPDGDDRNIVDVFKVAALDAATKSGVQIPGYATKVASTIIESEAVGKIVAEAAAFGASFWDDILVGLEWMAFWLV
jgi:hypothetical protein